MSQNNIRRCERVKFSRRSLQRNQVAVAASRVAVPRVDDKKNYFESTSYALLMHEHTPWRHHGGQPSSGS